MGRITVRLTPRAGRDAIRGWDGDELRVRVARPPVGGKANVALLKLLAKALGVAPSRLAIVSGTTARTKVVDIEGMAPDEARQLLGASPSAPRQPHRER